MFEGSTPSGGTMQVEKTYKITLDQEEMNFMLDVLNDFVPADNEYEKLHAKIHNGLISANQGEDV